MDYEEEYYVYFSFGDLEISKSHFDEMWSDQGWLFDF